MTQLQGEQAMPEQKYVSLSHIIPAETVSQGENGDSLSVFTITSAETTTITATDPVKAGIYRGIFSALQGPPKTKAEVLNGLRLENEHDREFAEKVFDALDSMTAIISVTGLTRALTRTWQNPAPYTPQGFASEAEGAAAREPRVINRSEASFAFEVEPSYERATTRLFDPDAPMDYRDLQQILVDSYRTTPDKKRPTPSPGGIYPVDIHVFNHGERVTDSADQPVFPAGVYQYDPTGLSLEQQTVIDPASGSAIAQHLTQNPDAGDPSVWVMLSIDSTAFEQKYGNASQMFLGTSIGSTMQRIIEVAEERGYGTLPLFGIQHHYADRDLLRHEGDIKTVLAIGIGKPAPDSDNGERREKNTLRSQLERVTANTEGVIQDSGRVNFATGRYTGMPSGFVGAWVKYAENNGGEQASAYSFGTDTTYEGALLKASAEALERAASGNVRVDKAMLAANELDAPWIDPRVVMPMSEEQMALSPTSPFDPDKKLNWTGGTRLRSGAKVYAPSEMIYYPYRETDELVMQATSSGVAAYTTTEEAARRGMLELIERDAIMRTWITQESPGKVSPDSTPDSVLYRLNEIASRGKYVDILDMTQDNGVPVYMAVIRSDTFPHFYTGAAAGFEPEKAMHKALDEAVVGFTSRVASEEALKKEEATKQANGKFDVDSHGMIYASSPELAKTLDWLFDGEFRDVPPQADIPYYQEIVDRYDPAVFELDNAAEGNDLRVVRVVAEDLIPIQFGEAGVPYMHHTIPKGTPAPSRPHFFN